MSKPEKRIISANYFFRNDEEWGVGLIVENFENENIDYINAVIKLGEKTAEYIQAGKAPDGPITIEDVVEQSKQIAKYLAPRKESTEDEAQEMRFIISSNIHAMSIVLDEDTLGEFNGSQYFTTFDDRVTEMMGA